MNSLKQSLKLTAVYAVGFFFLGMLAGAIVYEFTGEPDVRLWKFWLSWGSIGMSVVATAWFIVRGNLSYYSSPQGSEWSSRDSALLATALVGMVLFAYSTLWMR